MAPISFPAIDTRIVIVTSDSLVVMFKQWLQTRWCEFSLVLLVYALFQYMDYDKEEKIYFTSKQALNVIGIHIK